MNREQVHEFMNDFQSQLIEVQVARALNRAFEATFSQNPDAARDALRELAHTFLRHPERGSKPRSDEPVGEGGRTKADEEIERERQQGSGSGHKCPHCGEPITIDVN